jgi:ABC-2 type transport system permease protein
VSPLRIQAIARKEIYHLIRDFRSLYLAFALPLILIFLFCYAISLDVNNIRTVIVDYDHSPLSRDFIRQLNGSPYFKIVDYPRDTASAARDIDYGRALMAVVIPSGWTANIKADREAPVQVVLDGSDPNFSGISRGYITAFIEKYNQRQLIQFLNRQGIERIKPPLEARIRIWFNEDLESKNFILPGIIALVIMIVGAMLTSQVIAREYENGTMETIRSLPVRAGEFLIGKAIPYFFIGLADVLVAVLMGQELFGIVMKSSFWLLVLATSVYLAVSMSLGLLISTLAKSQLVAIQYAVLITYIPSLVLSNFIFPVLNMPKALQFLAYIVPATYYNYILRGIYLKDIGFFQMWPSYLVLTGMFLTLIIINGVVLKKEGL